MNKIWFVNNPQNHGPFDIIGDVHGCYNELVSLLDKLGWVKDTQGSYFHPQKRSLCFVGDLVDRGPDSPKVIRLAMDIIKNKRGYWVKGNHDDKWARYLNGNNVKISHGIKETIEQFKNESTVFKKEVKNFIDNLPIYAILDDNKLLIVHAGLRENLHGQATERAEAFSLFGKPSGQYDENGYPIRYRWQDDYTGDKTIVYGHVALEEVENINNCIDIDTACVFGGKLTALRWPEQEFVQIPSQTKWEKPIIIETMRN